MQRDRNIKWMARLLIKNNDDEAKLTSNQTNKTRNWDKEEHKRWSYRRNQRGERGEEVFLLGEGMLEQWTWAN